MTDVHEFTELDPQEFHLVPAGANGFPVLLAKAIQDEIDVETEAEKAKLHAADRKKLPDSAFALPEKREYPIHDENHARAALSMLHNASPEDQKRIKAAVHRRYPNIGKDDDVSDSKKANASPEASLAQTHAVDAGPGPACDPSADDGGEPRSLSFPHGDVSDGEGDTAPDKNVPRGEALSQTPGAQTNKETVDGGGDTAPDKDLHEDEAESQTSATPANDSGASSDAPYAAATAQNQNASSVKAPFVAMDNSAAGGGTGGNADSTPGNPAWEQKDAALADCASHLLLQANQLITMLGARERAEKGEALSPETEGVIRQTIEDLTKALTDNHPIVSKEIEDMTDDELMKLLDERDEARRKARKARKAEKAAQAAEEAAKAEATPAEDADASKAAEPTVEDLRKQLADAEERLAKVEAQDGKHVAVNAAGATAMLRGTPEQRDSVFKQLEDRLAEAKESGDSERIRTAHRQLTAAKLVAQENQRQRGEIPQTSRFGPDSAELFVNTGSLPEDTDLHGV